MPESGKKKPKNKKTNHQKTGKRLHDKVFELLLKKRDITRQKAIHVKNGKWEEMAIGKEGAIVGDIFFANFHDVTLFSIFKKHF